MRVTATAQLIITAAFLYRIKFGMSTRLFALSLLDTHMLRENRISCSKIKSRVLYHGQAGSQAGHKPSRRHTRRQAKPFN